MQISFFNNSRAYQPPTIRYRTTSPELSFSSLWSTESFHNSFGKRRLLFGLEIVEQDGTFLGLLTPVADDNAGAVDYFSGVTFAVEHTWRKWVISDDLRCE